MKQDTKHIIKIYLQPAFLICVTVLAVSGAGTSIAIKTFGLYLRKEPLLLRKSLDLLDQASLAPYKVISKKKIENSEILKSLGTDDYIQWALESTEEYPISPGRRCLLFITYYPLPDQVPHVPEECYTGGGFEEISSSDVTFVINNDGFKKDIQGKYLVFATKGSDRLYSVDKFPVLYFFRVNGDYVGNREKARLALNKNLFNKYSYFCKVELVFNQSMVVLSKEDALIESQKILGVVLPVLERDHWPKWEK